MAQNSSFLPGTTLQFAWDSTSLGVLKECPAKYFYSVVQGYVPKSTSAHLIFGQIYHAACERYDHAKAEGLDHEAALLRATQYTLLSTWDQVLNRPWDSEHNLKNRATLLRTVVWFLDQFKDDPLETVILENGKPAVELSFRFNTDYTAPNGEPYLLCGHLDRVVEFQGHTYIADKKTTGTTLSSSFFDHFSPDNQFSLYSLASKVVYNQNVAGLIVDAAQVAVSFSRFSRGFVARNDAILEEWYTDLGYYIKAAETYAEHHYYPRNDKSCGSYGGCPYRGICSKPPSQRPQWLEAQFAKRVWDPLQVRGDI